MVGLIFIVLGISIGLSFNIIIDFLLISALKSLILKKILVTIRPYVLPFLHLSFLFYLLGFSLSFSILSKQTYFFLLFFCTVILLSNVLYMQLKLNPYLIKREKADIAIKTDVGLKWHIYTGFSFGSAFVAWVLIATSVYLFYL